MQRDGWNIILDNYKDVSDVMMLPRTWGRVIGEAPGHAAARLMGIASTLETNRFSIKFAQQMLGHYWNALYTTKLYASYDFLTGEEGLGMPRAPNNVHLQAASYMMQKGLSEFRFAHAAYQDYQAIVITVPDKDRRFFFKDTDDYEMYLAAKSVLDARTAADDVASQQSHLAVFLGERP